MGETTYYRVQSREQPRGWAFGFSLLVHVGIIAAMGLFLHAPLPPTNLPGPIKVMLISMPAAPKVQKTTPLPVRQKPVQSPPVVKQPPVVKPRPILKPKPIVQKQIKPVIAIKPEVIPDPKPETIPQQLEEPLPAVETIPATDAVPEITDNTFATEGEIVTPTSREEAGAVMATNPTTTATTATTNIIQNYSNLIRERINKVKRYPLMARKSGKQGTVIVEFSVNQKGKLLNSQVINGCGTKALDRAALKALNRASPFAPLPEGLKGPHTFNLQVNFYLAG